ncbi:dna double-strand break repair rad50 ATPase [Schistosoma japonicum]|nr:dna double-strand break repair rad50 ATPase [Schistosoma japonicum]
MDEHAHAASGSSHCDISQHAIYLLKNIYETIYNGNIQSITEGDINNIKLLINDLRSLNKIRCHARQVLETESIKTSALKVKLQQFKKQKVEELFDKRNLIRILNEKELQNLKESLTSIRSTYEESEQELRQLTHIVELLRLHELKSNEENSVTVDTLNNCLDNKANKQIFLNQKIEEVEITELKIKEVQKMLDQLNAEITEERRNAVRKIIKLEDETKKVKKAIDAQIAKNQKLEIPHQEVTDELRCKRFEEFSLSNTIDELYNNIHEYKIKKSTLMNTIQMKENEIKIANNKRDYIQQSLDKMLKEHEESMQNIRNELKRVEESQQISILNIEAYEKKKEILIAVLLKIEKEYMMKAEQTAQLQEQIKEMNEKIENLNLSNNSLLDNLKQQAEMMKSNLANERKERVQVQRRQRKLHKQIGSFNNEQNLCVRKCQRRINEAKTLSKLLNESNEFCQQLENNIQEDLPKLKELNKKVQKIEMIETESKSLQVETNFLYTELCLNNL